MKTQQNIVHRIALRITGIVKSRWAKVLLIVACVLLAAGYYAVNYTWVGMLTIVFQQNPGRFHRERFEQVVEQVRLSGLKSGETRTFVLEDMTDPKSLRPPREGELWYRPGAVWGELTADGKLKVVIQTRALGHAGRYGFAYSEAPLSLRSYGGSRWQYLDLPCDLNLALPSMKIDEKWWKMLNNLD
ncbi:MAG TPA: hypothetical protein VM186_06085 [Planctomycetota bacterium]|nr:hypothetical protein [Planctomycetota bacterium]